MASACGCDTGGCGGCRRPYTGRSQFGTGGYLSAAVATRLGSGLGTACWCPPGAVQPPDVPLSGGSLRPGHIVIVAARNDAPGAAVDQDVAALLTTVPLSTGVVLGLRWFGRAAPFASSTSVVDVRYTLTEDVPAGTTLVARTVDAAGGTQLFPVDKTGVIAAPPAVGTAVSTQGNGMSAPANDSTLAVYALGCRGAQPLYMVGWGPDATIPTDAPMPVLHPLTDPATYTVVPLPPARQGNTRCAYVTRVTPVLGDTVTAGAGQVHVAYITGGWKSAGADLASRGEAWTAAAPWTGLLQDTAAPGVKVVYRVALAPGQLLFTALRQGDAPTSVSAQFEVVLAAPLPPGTAMSWTADPYVEGAGLDLAVLPNVRSFAYVSPARTLLAGTSLRFTVPPSAAGPPTVTIFDDGATNPDVGDIYADGFTGLPATSWIAAVVDAPDYAAATDAFADDIVQYVAIARATDYTGGLPPSLVRGVTTSTEVWPTTSAIFFGSAQNKVEFYGASTVAKLLQTPPTPFTTAAPVRFLTHITDGPYVSAGLRTVPC